MPPWQHWYHCMGNTYGTWLPGDPRGFRTRHHQEHIPYDYKHPPPDGIYAAHYDRSKRLMKREPVYLSLSEQRQRVKDEFVASLRRRDIRFAIVSIDRIHFHALVRFPDHNPRHWIGLAKKESSHYCKEAGHAPAGGIWGAACACKPIADAKHFRAVTKYIANHAQRGAAVCVVPPPQEMSDFDPDSLRVD